MVQKRRKRKSAKFRGSKTHGYGSMKKHRGAGHRGGRGNAGSGKRADAKKPSLWKNWKSGKDPAKVGFLTHNSTADKTINIGHLSSIADSLVASKHALLTQGAIVINLREMGYTKLLGSGTVKRKLKVSVARAVPAAKEKIEKAGGTLDATSITDKEATMAAREEKKKAKAAKK